MGMKEWWKRINTPELVNPPQPESEAPVTPIKEKKPRKPKAPAPTPVPVSEKDLATQHGAPWVNVLSVDLDMDNISNGAFNLDWNEIFVARLVKAGYKGKDDISIVDQWFTDVCRNVLMETYEQHSADPTNRKR